MLPRIWTKLLVLFSEKKVGISGLLIYTLQLETGVPSTFLSTFILSTKKRLEGSCRSDSVNSVTNYALNINHKVSPRRLDRALAGDKVKMRVYVRRSEANLFCFPGIEKKSNNKCEPAAPVCADYAGDAHW